jgi:deoxyribose-phosphate aldolase
VAEDRELERLVEVIVERVRARLEAEAPEERAGGAVAGVGASAATLRDTPCESEHPTDCKECGLCVVRRPWSVRAAQDAGAGRIASAPVGGEVPADLAGMIDHTLLKADATRDDIKKLCDEARKYKFASVCVNTTWVNYAREALRGSGVMVCCVVGFPLGAMSPTAKAYEAREAVRQGAQEIDMVINIGALKSRDYETVFEDICRVVKASSPAGVKVILETGALTLEEKIVACSLAKLSGAAFVKTSTGFGPGGATVEDIALMRKLVGAEMGVKASGGVRTREDAERMARAGANRLGASASVAIVTGGDQKTEKKDDSKGAKKSAAGGY